MGLGAWGIVQPVNTLLFLNMVLLPLQRFYKTVEELAFMEVTKS
jgi:hypothetical protein